MQSLNLLVASLAEGVRVVESGLVRALGRSLGAASRDVAGMAESFGVVLPRGVNALGNLTDRLGVRVVNVLRFGHGKHQWDAHNQPRPVISTEVKNRLAVNIICKDISRLNLGLVLRNQQLAFL